MSCSNRNWKLMMHGIEKRLIGLIESVKKEKEIASYDRSWLNLTTTKTENTLNAKKFNAKKFKGTNVAIGGHSIDFLDCTHDCLC